MRVARGDAGLVPSILSALHSPTTTPGLRQRANLEAADASIDTTSLSLLSSEAGGRPLTADSIPELLVLADQYSRPPSTC